MKQRRRTTSSKQSRRSVTTKETVLIAFNKPFNVLTQFTDAENRQTLKHFIPVQDVYPAGRLDRDSEGLLLLTNNGVLQHSIASPDKKMVKTYWVQVEGMPDTDVINQLQAGVSLKEGMTRPACARIISPPNVWQRTPPIRERKSIPDSWLEIKISEGKNRQVRRMTAAVGHPTLRLIRVGIGPWTLDGLASGEWQRLDVAKHSGFPSQ